MSGPKLYNLNVNVSTALTGGLLALDPQSATPRTPEIVNSLIAMTNPFDHLARTANGGVHSPGSEDSSSGTGSPFTSPTNSPPSVQHTCSQLIKEGLKLTIQTKRKLSGSETSKDDDEVDSKRSKKEELTAEDEERRKRRRERNKIAATKCRMKKREKTANLVSESEVLEMQNVDLKSQIQELEKQRRKLADMLSAHTPTCVRNAASSANPNPPIEDFSAFENFDFQIGSTNGTPLSAFSKDPNFARPYPYPNAQYYQPKVKSREPDKKQAEMDVYRVNNFRCNEDVDAYRPNGVIDANFYTANNRTDNLFVSEYNFTNGVLDNGCMA